MARPRLTLLDEPSLGLAPLLVKEIFRLSKKYTATKTMAFLKIEQ